MQRRDRYNQSLTAIFLDMSMAVELDVVLHWLLRYVSKCFDASCLYIFAALPLPREMIPHA